jgi:hypothetical protein
VDNRFGTYGRCNICVNGTDNHGNNTCTNGVYWCDCGSFGGPPVQCEQAVGRQNLSLWLGNGKPNPSHKITCRTHGGAKPQPWDCWKDAVGQKVVADAPGGGFWYSTTSNGYCGPEPNANPARFVFFTTLTLSSFPTGDGHGFGRLLCRLKAGRRCGMHLQRLRVFLQRGILAKPKKSDRGVPCIASTLVGWFAQRCFKIIPDLC